MTIGLNGYATDKRGYANRWRTSVRTCDNWLASGLPHFKLSPRRVRICVSEADQWMREQFGVRRIGKENARRRQSGRVLGADVGQTPHDEAVSCVLGRNWPG